VAEALARQGCAVVMNSRDEARVSAAAARLREGLGASAPPISHVAANLDAAAEIERLWAGATADGPIDILVSNTGGPPPGTFDQFTDAQWQQAFEGLMLSVVRLWRLALPGMRQRGWGRLLAITSSSAKEPLEGLMLSTAMRAGIAGMVRTLAREEAPHGITVNNVCPSLTATERLEKLFEARAKATGSTPEEVRAAMIKALPRGRLVDPAEFAATVAFLASPAAAALSGLSLTIDAGAGRHIFG
jgi:3-oxoacyl-[acyl-carrier protein] reductase